LSAPPTKAARKSTMPSAMVMNYRLPLYLPAFSLPG
jgi:hypothetical protein